MLFQGGFTFTNFIADAFTIFMFVLWFWLLIVVSGDLFRRHDVSGFAKVLWVIAFILFSYIGVFAYLLTQGRGMAERNQARANEARGELRQIVGFSAADEIAKLDRLKSTGSISEQECSPESQARGVAGASLARRKVLSHQRSPTCISTVRWPMEISFARHQFPPGSIRHAVWLYLRFTLSFRDVEDLLAERGLDVSYETVRRWVLKFGGARYVKTWRVWNRRTRKCACIAFGVDA